jgi:hypothetical protein
MSEHATAPMLTLVEHMGRWLSVKDGDARARALFDRHYSRRKYKDGRKPMLFVGPGEKMVLMTADCLALFVWCKFRSNDGQEGVSCTVFRNEGPHLSSNLIREACELAEQRWPSERQYTYVRPTAIRSTNPGYCFKRAGWQVCGTSKGGHVILERWPVVGREMML